MAHLSRSLTGLAFAALALGLTACATKAPVAQAPAPAPAVVEVAVVQPTAERDVHGALRFNMSEGDKKMTADQFDAWMKANGIRVARGATPAAPAAEAETAKDSSKH